MPNTGTNPRSAQQKAAYANRSPEKVEHDRAVRKARYERMRLEDIERRKAAYHGYELTVNRPSDCHRCDFIHACEVLVASKSEADPYCFQDSPYNKHFLKRYGQEQPAPVAVQTELQFASAD